LLIATTVVEVGISLPRLTTVVIVGAERLGLSTLHQLRGRVSRTGLKGYCYLYTNQNSSDRLDEFVSTKSGFDIANLDLKFRKSGDLLKGVSQSGSQFRFVDIGEDEEIVSTVKNDLAIC
ncbi:MAG: ATP-dependent DNA helicase RecG, partial [Epsilonproteobacteria bacterium]